MWTLTYPLLAAIMAAITEHASSGPFNGPLEAVYLGLYIAPTTTIHPNSLLSAITEATYDGYARQEIVWFPTYQDNAGPQALEGQSLYFSPTDATVGNVITGLFLATAETGGVLLAAQALGGIGYPLNGPTSALVVVPAFQLDPTANYGGAYVTP